MPLNLEEIDPDKLAALTKLASESFQIKYIMLAFGTLDALRELIFEHERTNDYRIIQYYTQAVKLVNNYEKYKIEEIVNRLIAIAHEYKQIQEHMMNQSLSKLGISGQSAKEEIPSYTPYTIFTGFKSTYKKKPQPLLATGATLKVTIKWVLLSIPEAVEYLSNLNRPNILGVGTGHAIFMIPEYLSFYENFGSCDFTALDIKSYELDPNYWLKQTQIRPIEQLRDKPYTKKEEEPSFQFVHADIREYNPERKFNLVYFRHVGPFLLDEPDNMKWLNILIACMNQVETNGFAIFTMFDEACQDPRTMITWVRQCPNTRIINSYKLEWKNKHGNPHGSYIDIASDCYVVVARKL